MSNGTTEIQCTALMNELHLPINGDGDQDFIIFGCAELRLNVTGSGTPGTSTRIIILAADHVEISEINATVFII